ncbi:HAD family hydrolase [Calothrix sp. UHCC 0171]|uniref:HAD-IA family hydrolase n=1 Tax=Calothrix sp. UHCC 0171 TaxID=3110245 RepID=UPI002B1F747E|nr:HAD family hydrolase [Calothrix sp. UHCC 0171]MEA5571690.1 HAD family hydrolase [Calothrix sp. UHCC 0171]
MERPKVIFLDAVGTLFGVKGSVGEIYSQVAREFGVHANPEILNQAFSSQLKVAPPATFPDVEDMQDIPQHEFEWWYAIAHKTFEQAGVIQQFADFDTFFSELYIHFGTGEPWFVYADVIPALTNWRKKGIQLGIVSNFDSRLFSVLQALELRDYFDSITISTQVGAAKPDPKIFGIALAKHNCPAESAWHVGDSKNEDYHGAKAVGMRGVWLHR